MAVVVRHQSLALRKYGEDQGSVALFEDPSIVVEIRWLGGIAGYYVDAALDTGYQLLFLMFQSMMMGKFLWMQSGLKKRRIEVASLQNEIACRQMVCAKR